MLRSSTRAALAATAVVLPLLLAGHIVGPAAAEGIRLVPAPDHHLAPVRPVLPISSTWPYPGPFPLPWWCYPTPAAPVPPGLPIPPTAVPTPVPSPTPGGMATSVTYTVCRQIQGRVPAAVQLQALNEPWTVHGFGERRNGNVPYHPLWNPLRTELNLLNPNTPYGPCNPVVWKSGCW